MVWVGLGLGVGWDVWFVGLGWCRAGQGGGFWEWFGVVWAGVWGFGVELGWFRGWGLV